MDSLLHLLKKWAQGEERQSAGADLGGGCRGGPPPRDDLRFSNATGILQKNLCGLLALK